MELEDIVLLEEGREGAETPTTPRTFTAYYTATDSTTTSTRTYSCPAYTAYNRGSLDDKALSTGNGGEAGYIADSGTFPI